LEFLEFIVFIKDEYLNHIVDCVKVGEKGGKGKEKSSKKMEGFCEQKRQ